MRQAAAGSVHDLRRLFLMTSLVWAAACGEAGPSTEMGEGPRVHVIGDDPACPECEIVLDEVALLGDALDSTSIREDAAGRGCMVGRRADGSFVVSGSVGGGRLVVRDGSGAAHGSIGRSGQGPGEFGRQLRVWIGPGDTLFVVDEGNARLQVLTAEGDFVRSFTLPARYRPFARLRSGDFLFHRTPTGPDDPMFHLTDPAGELLRSFGQPELDEYDLESRLVAPSPSGGFWTGSMWHYELRHWASADSVTRVVRREAEWFPGGVWWSEGLYDEDPPGPHLISVWEDDQGLLWVYSGVADAAWRPNESRIPDPEWHRMNFDVVIEVLDLSRNRVIARRTVDYMLGEVCGSPWMYAVEWAESGDTRARVLHPRLAR